MRRIRETLRLHLQAGLSYSEVGGALKISKSVVGKYVLLARVAGVDCAVAETLNDEELEARLYSIDGDPGPVPVRNSAAMQACWPRKLPQDAPRPLCGLQ